MAAAKTPSTDCVSAVPLALSALGITLAGANFGLFFAWISTTMWGLDTASATTAVEAMQAMNRSVRNGVFAAVFFTAAPVLLLAGGISLISGATRAGALLGAAGLVMALGNNAMTFAALVPMNEAFGDQRPSSMAEAQALWQGYSATWQAWNTARTGFCGLSFGLALLGGGLLLRTSCDRGREPGLAL